MWNRNSLRIYIFTLICIMYSAHATFRHAKYYKAQGPISLTQESLYSEKARCPNDCSARCLIRNCSCFYFDKLLQLCHTGNCTAANAATDTSKVFYVSCDSNDGFKSITYGSITACVWLSSTEMKYISARDDCKARSAQLYTVKSLEKLKILQQNYHEFSWLGLNDMANDNNFTWEDDNSLINITYRNQIFVPGDPIDDDCVMYHPNWKLLTDYGCDKFLTFICEKPFFN